MDPGEFITQQKTLKTTKSIIIGCCRDQEILSATDFRFHSLSPSKVSMLRRTDAHESDFQFLAKICHTRKHKGQPLFHLGHINMINLLIEKNER